VRSCGCSGIWERVHDEALRTDQYTMGGGEASAAATATYGRRGRQCHEIRAVLARILWVLGIGAQWGGLPVSYSPLQTRTVGDMGYARTRSTPGSQRNTRSN